MLIARLSLVCILLTVITAVMFQWYFAVGFNVFDGRWWEWVLQTLVHPQGLPEEMARPLMWTGGAGLVAMLGVAVLAARAANHTVSGGRAGHELHGTARWAATGDVQKAGLFARTGVTVGGWRGLFRTRTLRHDGPEHVMVFAPTRSGKGVSLILPTLLTWEESIFVLDIKGENYALSAGWRAARGHRIWKFEPTSASGESVRFNPLAEVRLDDGQDIMDCQNIASMIIDPDGKGLQDYWRQEGWGWLSVVILHVIYRARKEEDRRACLDDVNILASGTINAETGEDNFDSLLDDMMAYEHGLAHVDKEVRRGAARMKIKAPNERSGVHSSAITQLALYADPVIARNTAVSDFALDDLVNGDTPAALYLIIRPSDIDRLRPLVRIIMNVMLRRLTERMEFDEGRSLAGYRHRLLLMLDEFTSIGKLEIFERALAFMAGYGLKAFVVVQDIAQLHQAYGKDESVMSNCHVRIAFAPNRIETARFLSDMSGKTTIVQRSRSRSGRLGHAGSLSDSLKETGRPLLTPDECLRLRLMGKQGRKIIPGEVLIFVAGTPPIRGVQRLYFQDRDLSRRAALAPPPIPSSPAPTAATKEQDNVRT